MTHNFKVSVNRHYEAPTREAQPGVDLHVARKLREAALRSRQPAAPPPGTYNPHTVGSFGVRQGEDKK